MNGLDAGRNHIEMRTEQRGLPAIRIAAAKNVTRDRQLASKRRWLSTHGLISTRSVATSPLTITAAKSSASKFPQQEYRPKRCSTMRLDLPTIIQL